MEGDGVHPAARLALGWAKAWNERDGDAFAPLVHPEFRMHRMSGEIIDVEGVRDLVARQSYGVGMSIFPRRLFGNGSVFVAEPRSSTAMWRRVSSAGARTMPPSFSRSRTRSFSVSSQRPHSTRPWRLPTSATKT